MLLLLPLAVESAYLEVLLPLRLVDALLAVRALLLNLRLCALSICLSGVVLLNLHLRVKSCPCLLLLWLVYLHRCLSLLTLHDLVWIWHTF